MHQRNNKINQMQDLNHNYLRKVIHKDKLNQRKSSVMRIFRILIMIKIWSIKII